jgi:anti-sigma B factor antagonist
MTATLLKKSIMESTCPEIEEDLAMSMLDISVTEARCGPVVVLSGEADLTTLAQLNSVLNEQIWAGFRLVTVDLSMLRFADSATIAALAQAARALRDRGGELELLRPQPAVARVLSLTGVDQTVIVRGAPQHDC